MNTLLRSNKEKLLLPVLGLASVGLVVLSERFGTSVFIATLALIGFVGVTALSFRYPRYNILLLLGLSFFIPLVMRMFRFYGPISNAIEGLSIYLFLILVIKGKLDGHKTVIGLLLMAWIAYNVMEVVNPNASSRTASILAVRSFIPLILGFYIVYSSTESIRDVRVFVVGILCLGLLSALYGLWQEFVGLPSYDFAWATRDERTYNLLFTWGRLRKFSFFFSAADFGMIMAMLGMLGVCCFFLFRQNLLKYFCGATGVICLWAMLYSGTRTAMVMVVAGFLIFTLITMNRQALIACAVGALALAVLIVRPTSSRTLFVMMTAFYASEDPSMNVRLKNQQAIRSHILAHPVGHGLGTTGYLGNKYSPHTFVGAFPPDSEYVKIAIETGWIGLFIWCAILGVIFHQGVNIYFKITDPGWKSLQAILLVLLFMMILSQYPQELFRSHILGFLFSSTLAIMAKIGTKFSDKTLQP